MSNTLIITEQNGDTTEVEPTLEDRLAFETALRRNKSWGKLEDNMLKLQPFLAWNAARRAMGDPRSWEEFTSGPTAAATVTEKAEDAGDPDEAGDLDVPGLGKDTPAGASTTPQSSSRASTAAPRGSGAEKRSRS